MKSISLPFVLSETDQYQVLFKPAGWFTHAPDDKRAKKLFRDVILTHWIEDNLHLKPFPIQRLDFATEGILISAKSKETASQLNALQAEGGIEKYYEAIVRGWTPEQGEITLSLESDSSFLLQECHTRFLTQKRIEFPKPAHPQFPTSRYSWLRVQILTGRWHQIRRHMNRISHPIVGDREHGCSHHNRFWRDQLGINGLMLKCQELQIFDPWVNSKKSFFSPTTVRWQKASSLLFI